MNKCEPRRWKESINITDENWPNSMLSFQKLHLAISQRLMATPERLNPHLSRRSRSFHFAARENINDLFLKMKCKCLSIFIRHPAASPDTPIPSPPQGPAPDKYKPLAQPLCPPASPSPSSQKDPWLLAERSRLSPPAVHFIVWKDESNHGG